MRVTTQVKKPAIRYGVGEIMPLSVPENRWYMLLMYALLGNRHPMRLKKVTIVAARHYADFAVYEYEDEA